MPAVHFYSITLLLVFSCSWSAAQDKKEKKEPADAIALSMAQGVVDKADKDSITIKPRGADGRFQKAITLSITGTSRLTILTPQRRGDKVVLTQRDGKPEDLTAGHVIAVIYAEAGKDGPVLLAAVAQSSTAK